MICWCLLLLRLWTTWMEGHVLVIFVFLWQYTLLILDNFYGLDEKIEKNPTPELSCCHVWGHSMEEWNEMGFGTICTLVEMLYAGAWYAFIFVSWGWDWLPVHFGPWQLLVAKGFYLIRSLTATIWKISICVISRYLILCCLAFIFGNYFLWLFKIVQYLFIHHVILQLLCWTYWEF